MTRGIGVGVIGLGFMGRTHVRAYRAAAEAGHANRLVRVCDRDPERFATGSVERGNMEAEDEGPLFDPEETAVGADPAELLADDAVELVSICTHTESHVDLALSALEAGKHVLVEKPVALTSQRVQLLADAAAASDRLCLPAMCMRFWPGWDWLKGAVEGGEHGAVRSAAFRRLASHPAWSPAFYGDPERSGGALFDLHVHDADLVRHLFGAPSSVLSTGTVDHVTTAYRFDDGPLHVTAEGGWDHSPGFQFFMGYTVVFERATASYALDREPALVLARDGGTEAIPLAAGTGYDGEVRHALALCRDGRGADGSAVHEAVWLTRMLEAERESMRSRAPVALDG
jgi:predicted dehydrogenase